MVQAGKATHACLAGLDFKNPEVQYLCSICDGKMAAATDSSLNFLGNSTSRRTWMKGEAQAWALLLWTGFALVDGFCPRGSAPLPWSFWK